VGTCPGVAHFAAPDAYGWRLIQVVELVRGRPHDLKPIWGLCRGRALRAICVFLATDSTLRRANWMVNDIEEGFSDRLFHDHSARLPLRPILPGWRLRSLCASSRPGQTRSVRLNSRDSRIIPWPLRQDPSSRIASQRSLLPRASPPFSHFRRSRHGGRKARPFPGPCRLLAHAFVRLRDRSAAFTCPRPAPC